MCYNVAMNTVEVTSEPATPSPKGKKHKMSPTQRKALSDAAKARHAAARAAADMAAVRLDPPVMPPPPAAPLPPSPAVLALQEQVVQRVSQRDEVRTRLTEAHTAYLVAQSRFQAAEAELKGIEQEVSYRISLIAQLENRPAQINYSIAPTALQIPANMTGISSEPTQPSAPQRGPQQTHAIGDANDLRREIRGMM
jgi:hypothetical protein